MKAFTILFGEKNQKIRTPINHHIEAEFDDGSVIQICLLADGYVEISSHSKELIVTAHARDTIRVRSIL